MAHTFKVPVFAEISVTYDNIEDNHVFKSDDVEGFSLAHSDGVKVFEDFIPALTKCLNDNHGLEFKPLIKVNFVDGEDGAIDGQIEISHQLPWTQTTDEEE